MLLLIIVVCLVVIARPPYQRVAVKTAVFWVGLMVVASSFTWLMLVTQPNLPHDTFVARWDALEDH